MEFAPKSNGLGNDSNIDLNTRSNIVRPYSLSPEIQDTYAGLIAGLWTNITPGQEVIIVGDACHAELMMRTVEAAKRLGASEVTIFPRDFETERLLLLNPPAQEKSQDGYHNRLSLERYYSGLAEAAARVASTRGCFIRIEGVGNPDILEGLDGKALNALESVRSQALKPLQDVVMKGLIKRCVVAAPTLGWAKKVFPAMPDDAAFNALSKIICEACFLTAADPAEAFLEEDRKLEVLREKLTSLEVNHLQFIDKEWETDFSVKLTAQSKWLGGVKTTVGGERFYANVPIGELFSTPDFRSAQGWIGATMPSKFSGVTIGDLRVNFQDGQVADFTCDPSKEQLMRDFFSDLSLRRIGEIALASVNSPLGKNECFFDSILYDEKMRCHLAFGLAYLTCINDSEALVAKAKDNPDAFLDLGINSPAARHVDVMISSNTTSVFGTAASGRQISLVENGDWAF